MSTRLQIQAPGEVSNRFIDEMLTAATKASRGGAIFAWATVPGLDALFGNPTTAALLKRGVFEIVVGTDVITSPAALTRLRELAHEYPNLSCRAFVHETQPLFHPKLAWFEVGSDLVLIVGSANLTNGGLVNNWEAYTVNVLAASERSSVESTISGWLQSEAANITGIDDAKVDAAVATNRIVHLFRSERVTPVQPPLVSAPSAIGVTDEILVAEIPKNRKDTLGRPQYSQVNFDQQTFEDFFGYSPNGGANTIVLMSVDGAGVLGSVESRQARYKQSVNWYFEIGATRGKPYPSGPGERPVAAFRRIGNGEFAYFVAVPGSPGYAELRALLDTRQTLAQAGTRMRRERFDTGSVAAHWPNCPLI